MGWKRFVFVTVVVIQRRSERSWSFRLYSGTCPAHPVEREEKREEERQEDGREGKERVGKDMEVGEETQKN